MEGGGTDSGSQGCKQTASLSSHPRGEHKLNTFAYVCGDRPYRFSYCTRTHCGVQTGLKLNPPVLDSKVLRLQATQHHPDTHTLS